MFKKKKFLIVCENTKAKKFGFIQTDNKAFITIKLKILQKIVEVCNFDESFNEYWNLMHISMGENVITEQKISYEKNNFEYIELDIKRIKLLNSLEIDEKKKIKDSVYCESCKIKILATSLLNHNKSKNHLNFIEQKNKKVTKLKLHIINLIEKNDFILEDGYKFNFKNDDYSNNYYNFKNGIYVKKIYGLENSKGKPKSILVAEKIDKIPEDVDEKNIINISEIDEFCDSTEIDLYS